MNIISTTTLSHQQTFRNKEILLLRMLTFAVFIGRAWQHWFWDIPIRSLFWDEELMKGIVESILGMSWEDYIINPSIDTALEWFTFSLGFVYAALALLTILIQKKHAQWLKNMLWVGFILLIGLATLYWKEKFMSVGQFIEYASQCAMPLLLYYSLSHINTPNYRFWIRIAIALTFIGHGLYALGYYPVPGSYVQMTLDVFGLSESTAYTLLKIAGILDLIVAIMIFIPRLLNPALVYCIIWGTLTAFARIVANFDIEIPWDSWHQWGHTTIYRLPHGGLPFLLWWLIEELE